MEEYSQLEHVTGSPTAGESGFVHVESIDSASMDGSAINQDDGVVVTRVNNVQDESSDLRMTDDGGNEEFVDCPDDLLSYDGKTDFDESQESQVVSEDNQHTILPHHYQEERQQLMTELTNLRHKLKVLIKKHPLIDGKDGELFTYEHATETVVSDDMSLWPLHEMVFDCSRFIELALSEQSQTENTVKELCTTLDTKDKEIKALNVKVTEHYSVETTTDRILTSLSNALGMEEFQNTDISGKMLHLEKSIYLLIENRNHFFSEVQMLNKGLTELKRKELELIHKGSHLEGEHRKLMEHFERGRETIKTLNSEIGRLKGEVEVEKTRYSNTREKLNLAVTKGKSLVQQRDSLKQTVVEKTSELDKCLVDLQEKSTLANSLQDEISTMKEDACVKIDRLIVRLLMETQEKNYLEDEFEDLRQKFEGVLKEVCVLKDKNGCLKIDLQRSEDKGSLLKEKLSMAVKKGKGLVQEREILKQKIAEKNGRIDALNLELKQQEDQIIKLESDFSQLKEEKDQIEQFLVESNNILQKVINATDEIVLQNDVNDPVEKVKLCAVYLKECQVSKAQVEQELRDVKDEALKTMKSLEDALSVSEKNVSELTEENTKLENVKTCIEEELQESCKHIKSLEDTVFKLQTNVSHENETVQKNIECEMKKMKDEASYHEHKFMEASETIKTLQDTLLKVNNTVSNLLGEKKNTEHEISILTDEFIRFSTSIDDVITSLLIKLEGIKNTMPITLQQAKFLQKSVHDLQIDKQVQEKKILIMSTTIKELESELDKVRSTYEKVKEENDMLQNRVAKVETESQTMRGEMVIKLKDYQAKEDEWNRRETELLKQVKDHEAEKKSGLTEGSSSTQSEISEVEDQVSIGKRSRTLRKGSNDHFALNIDPESDHLIDKQETVQDKGHVFKSLHTSGLVPPQGKIIADRLDGIWVSGGGALMSRPRARLGVMVYWLVLHLWLVATLL